MAPLKFEEKIQEKLEQHTIQPSKDSWDRLATQLNNHQDRKKSRKIIWYSIAAVFIGFLMVTSVFRMNHLNSDATQTQIVDIDQERIENTKATKDSARVSPLELTNIQQEDIVWSKPKDKKNRPFKERIKNTVPEPLVIEQDGYKNEKGNEVIVATTKSMLLENKGRKEKINIDAKIMDDKVAEVASRIKSLQEDKGSVTDEEIEKLLFEAQRSIATKQIIKSGKVNATALLQDVEEELDETFKERVFEALKNGFRKVKTKVADRKN